MADSDDIRSSAARMRSQAQIAARAQYLASKHASRRNATFGLPVVVLSALVGTSIFASLSQDPSAGWKIATGMTAVLAGVLASVQTFFRFEEVAEHHRSAAARYSQVTRELDLLLLRNRDDRREAQLRDLETLARNLSAIESDAPDVSDEIYDRAKAERVSSEGR